MFMYVCIHACMHEYVVTYKNKIGSDFNDNGTKCLFLMVHICAQHVHTTLLYTVLTHF